MRDISGERRPEYQIRQRERGFEQTTMSSVVEVVQREKLFRWGEDAVEKQQDKPGICESRESLMVE